MTKRDTNTQPSPAVHSALTYPSRHSPATTWHDSYIVPCAPTIPRQLGAPVPLTPRPCRTLYQGQPADFWHPSNATAAPASPYIVEHQRRAVTSSHPSAGTLRRPSQHVLYCIVLCCVVSTHQDQTLTGSQQKGTVPSSPTSTAWQPAMWRRPPTLEQPHRPRCPLDTAPAPTAALSFGSACRSRMALSP